MVARGIVRVLDLLMTFAWECFVAVNWSEATESALSPLVVCLTSSIGLESVNCRQIEIVLTNSSAIFVSLYPSKVKLS